MVPDDIVKPPHIGIAISQLTPEERPDELTDLVWGLVEECAAEQPDFDAVEIHECLTEGPCSDKLTHGHESIALSMVLYVLATWDDADASSHAQRIAAEDDAG